MFIYTDANIIAIKDISSIRKRLSYHTEYFIEIDLYSRGQPMELCKRYNNKEDRDNVFDNIKAQLQQFQEASLAQNQDTLSIT